MGYQTSFAIRVHGADPAVSARALDQLADSLQDMLRYSVHVQDPAKLWDLSVERPRYWDALGDEPFIAVDDAKWYEHEDDLDELTRRHQVKLWILGIGESALWGDLWVQTYQNGYHTEKLYLMTHVLAAMREE